MMVHVTRSENGQPFIGSDALSAGEITGAHLRSTCRRVFPDVYADASFPVDPLTQVRAAALWAPPGSVVCGLAAALIHGERWYAPEAVRSTVDLYVRGTPKVPVGVRLRRLRVSLPAEQIVMRSGLAITSVERTVVDVARWEDDDERAIAKIDALCNRTGTDVSVVRSFASGLDRLHGLRRVQRLLGLCDHSADSPPETRLRLILTRSGLPVATPQLRIFNEYGVKITVADFGFEKERVAIFYDGAVHRQRSTWEHDAQVNAELAELGWQVIRVTAQMLRSPATLLRLIDAALRRGRVAP